MAKPTRFPFGIALGYENQFNAYGRGGPNTPSPVGTQYEQVTAGLIAQGSGIVDVSQGSLFYTANTVTTVITSLVHYQLGRAGGLTAAGQTDVTSPPPEGKIVTLFFIDNSTSIANAANIFLAGTDNMTGANHTITLIASNSSWYEMARSKTTRNEFQTYTIAAASSINVDDTKVALVTNTGAGSVFLSALSGGQVGQRVTIMAGTSGLSLFVQTGGNIAIAGTNAYLIAVSGAYDFIKRSGTRWNMLTIGTLGLP